MKLKLKKLYNKFIEYCKAFNNKCDVQLDKICNSEFYKKHEMICLCPLAIFMLILYCAFACLYIWFIFFVYYPLYLLVSIIYILAHIINYFFPSVFLSNAVNKDDSILITVLSVVIYIVLLLYYHSI
jgi:hypothetical protein